MKRQNDIISINSKWQPMTIDAVFSFIHLFYWFLFVFFLCLFFIFNSIIDASLNGQTMWGNVRSVLYLENVVKVNIKFNYVIQI